MLCLGTQGIMYTLPGLTDLKLTVFVTLKGRLASPLLANAIRIALRQPERAAGVPGQPFFSGCRICLLSESQLPPILNAKEQPEVAKTSMQTLLRQDDVKGPLQAAWDGQWP